MSAEVWWYQRLQCYDIMPHLTGVIVHPVRPYICIYSPWVCVWAEVYKKEFVPQMQDIGYAWSLEAGSEGSYATWRAARNRALLSLSRDTYGADYPK
eukprot:5538595-Pleurochrysis_carterae.AAC.1